MTARLLSLLPAESQTPRTASLSCAGELSVFRSEGSDASQAIETLQVVSRDLANFYVQQSVMRRTVWAQKCHDKISPQSGNCASASAHR